MTASNDANLGLYYGWNLGEDGWNVGMDLNMVTLGGVIRKSVISRSTTTPAVSPTDGDRYYVPVGATGVWLSNTNTIAIWSDFETDWVYVPVLLNFQFRVEDESDLEVVYNGAALVDSVDISGFLTTSSNYTATGTVEFTAATTFTGSHTANGDELATMDDVDVKIAAQDFSGFVATTGAQSIADVKTFTSPISGVDAVAASDLATLSQVNSVSGNTTGLNIGGFAEFFKQKTGDDLEIRTIQSTTGDIVIVQNTDDISLTFAGSLGVNDFISLDDTPADYSGAANQLVAVNGVENAVEFIDAFGETFLDLTDTPASMGTVGQIAAVNIGATALEFIDAPDAGVSTFIALTDTPTLYTAQANFFLRVNATADGVSFDNITVPETFLDLTDTPSAYTGLENYTVVVNATATALEFKEPPVNPVYDFLDLNDTPNTYTSFSGYVPVVNGGEDGLTFQLLGGFDDTSLAAYVAAAGISLTGVGCELVSTGGGSAVLEASGTGNAIVQNTGTGSAGLVVGSNTFTVDSTAVTLVGSSVPVIINATGTGSITLNTATRTATNVQTSAMTGGTSDLYLSTKKYVDDNAFSNTALAAYTAAADVSISTGGGFGSSIKFDTIDSLGSFIVDSAFYSFRGNLGSAPLISVTDGSNNAAFSIGIDGVGATLSSLVGNDLTLNCNVADEINLDLQTTAMNSGAPSALAISTKGYADDLTLRTPTVISATQTASVNTHYEMDTTGQTLTFTTTVAMGDEIWVTCSATGGTVTLAAGAADTLTMYDIAVGGGTTITTVADGEIAKLTAVVDGAGVAHWKGTVV